MGLILLCLVNLSLAVLVIAHNRRAAVNKLFASFVIATVGWIASISLALSVEDAAQTILLGRLAFAFASAMPFTLLWMFQAFPTQVAAVPKSGVFISGIFCVALIFLSLSPWIVAGANPGLETPDLLHGPLYPVFVAYTLLCFALALFILWKKIQAAAGIKKLQLRYLLLGILIGGAGAIATNLLIPLVWKTSRYSVLGPYFSMIMVAFCAHAIIRYRLMDTRLVIRHGVVYLLAVATAAGVFVSLLLSITTFMSPHLRNLPLWVEVALALLVALFFQPLRRWIQTSLDRYVYREPYNYQRIIREASRAMVGMLDLKSLLNYVCEIIGRTVRPETVSIYIRNQDGSSFMRSAIRRFIDDSNTPEPEAIVPQHSALPDFLARTRTHFLRDEAATAVSDNPSQEALSHLSRFKGEMVLPILQEEQLTGFLIVGPKLSGDPYFLEDIDLLSTLTGQAAIAIKNAQLYQEVALVNEYVANIVATMESGVIAIGANGRITLFNPAAERMTGLDAKSVRLGPISHLPANLARALEGTLADGKPRIQPETMISDATGRLTPISYSTYVLRDQSGAALGAVAVFADLTSLKDLEAERRRAERLASFGALASGIAHEIKNPLVAIRTFAELLPERFTEEDFREDFSKVVTREIQRIDDLVARLRGLAAPTTHALAPLDLREPIEETLALLRAQLEQKRVRVRRLYDPTLPPVTGDPAQLKQLFLNLFMNALEAMESEGELTVQLQQRTRYGTSTISAKISDTGGGIPEALLGKIFDPFVTTKPRGSGLGLAICRRITDAHGATIRADNNADGRGCSITIVFPAVIPAEAAMNQ